MAGRLPGRHFDAVAHRYAVEVAGGVDALAVTHLDRVPPELRICTSYDLDGQRWERIVPGPPRDLGYQAGLTSALTRARPGDLYRPADWVEAIGDELGRPVAIESHGPRTSDKRIRALSAG